MYSGKCRQMPHTGFIKWRTRLVIQQVRERRRHLIERVCEAANDADVMAGGFQSWCQAGARSMYPTPRTV